MRVIFMLDFQKIALVQRKENVNDRSNRPRT